MKLAFINTFDTKDVKNWAGIPYYLCQQLESKIGKDKIACIQLPSFRRTFRSYLTGFYYNKLLGKKYYTWADKRIVKAATDCFRQQEIEQFDIIITFEFFLVSILKTQHNQVIYWNDATFENLLGFYSGYSNLCGYCIRDGHALQKQAFLKADSIIYSSDWAIASARKFYGVDEKKLKKILFASNFKFVPAESDIRTIIKRREENTVKLLFLAVDWERKGGDKAVEVVEKLNQLGVATQLFVVGMDIPVRFKNNGHLTPFGFVNKRSAEGENKLMELIKDSHFLILPTVADCTPVVFSEANSFALPVLTTNVGGIPSVIKKNENGYYFNDSEFVMEATDFIIRNLPSSENYRKLCYKSYFYYNREMSWHQVDKKLNLVFQELSMNRTEGNAVSLH